MIDSDPLAITDQRLLAAMKAVNPPIERLMADRLSLRQELRATNDQLDRERRRGAEIAQVLEVSIPRYVAVAKTFTVATAALALIVLGISFFTGHLQIQLPASLFASLLFPLWLVDMAERRFGRWEIRFGPPIHFRFVTSSR